MVWEHPYFVLLNGGPLEVSALLCVELHARFTQNGIRPKIHMKQQQIFDWSTCVAQALCCWCVMVGLVACGGGDGGGGEEAKPTVEPPVPTAAQLCATARVFPQILNGAVCAQPEQTPVVQLTVVTGFARRTQCSGSVVGPRQVLTAAHCLPENTVAVEIDVLEKGTTVTKATASRWVTHPMYSVGSMIYYNDAAVVTFTADLPNPLLPLLTSEPTAVGQRMYIAGWGKPVFDLAVGYADVQFVDAWHIGYVYDGITSNTCSGDSGGPAYRLLQGQPALVGITSSGSESGCGAGDRALYTNVQTAPVLSFLRTEVAGLQER